MSSISGIGVGLITTLEADVSRMQKETTEKVATLTREKEDAFKAARYSPMNSCEKKIILSYFSSDRQAVERLQMDEESFQARVAEKEKAMRNSMQQLYLKRRRGR